MIDFYKVIENGYIIAIGTNGPDTADEIATAEYNEILEIIQNAPASPDGYIYKLRADNLTWDLVELPLDPEEAEISDYENALADLGVRLE